MLWRLLGRALCSQNEVCARVYSQIYKVLPEFKYPQSIQDEPSCYFNWWGSKMETYKLFQVKPLPLLVPPHPGATRALPKCRESRTCGKGKPSPGSFSVCFLWPWDSSLLGWGRSSGWTSSAFSQGAALKLFTNARTRGDCPPFIPMYAMPGPGGEHGP